MKISKTAIYFGAALLTVSTISAWAASHAGKEPAGTGVAAERQFVMKNVGAATKALAAMVKGETEFNACLLYTSPSPRDKRQSRMPSSA